MSQIIDRTPEELEALRIAYLRKPKSHLIDLAQRLGTTTKGRKAALVAGILTKCAKLIHTTSLAQDLDQFVYLS